MIKLIFELNVEDDWPPVGAESLWFDKSDRGFQLKSIPFFVEGIAYDDVLEIDIIDEIYGIIRSVKNYSGNSTIWAYFREGSEEKRALSKLAEMNFGYEGGALAGYFSINLPKDGRLEDLISCIKEYIDSDMVELAYGSLRH